MDKRRVLNHKESFALATLLQAEWLNKRMTDEQFAKYASEILGFTVTKGQVYGARVGFELPACHRQHPPATGTVLECLTRLEKQVAFIANQLDLELPQ